MSRAGLIFARRMLRAGVVVLLLGTGAGGQPTAGDITGRTFHGVRLPLAVTTGPIGFAASKAWAWTEESPKRADGSGGALVQRMLLSGDVRASLGGYELTASRAAVWMEQLEGSDAGAWQVWVYMERGGSAVQAGGIRVTGDRLPVQGIIRPEGGIAVKAVRLEHERPEDPFLAEAERALAVRLREMVRGPGPEPRSAEDLLRQGLPVEPLTATRPERTALDAERIREAERNLPPADLAQPIFAKGGVFTLLPRGDIVGRPVEGQDAWIAERGMVISYWDRSRDSTVQLTAERVVVFLAPGKSTTLDVAGPIDRDDLHGIYLEGDVVAEIQGPDGHFSIRSPRVFYSVAQNRAVLIDAVFWTQDLQRGLPLYVRARTIEQESANQFRATRARLTNTPFFLPGLSVGTSSVTITGRTSEEGERSVYVDARDLTLRAGEVPFFYWPRLRGEPEALPLKDLRLENSSGSGAALKTTWDLLSLTGVRHERTTNAELMLDHYFDRGPAVGTEVTWNSPAGGGSRGGVRGYIIPEDNGRDLLSTGAKKDHDHETRGMITAEHRAAISDDWTLLARGAYISDETFVDGFFEEQARTGAEFTNSLYTRRLRDNTALYMGAEARANDFIANEYLKQAPGYSVDRYPDIGYARLADDLITDHPGLLTYSSEYRFTQMRINFDEVPVNQYGFTSAARARSLFGVVPGESIADALRRLGYTQKPVTRFDTRHGLDMPLSAGPVHITPFVAVRGTAYNDDFAEFAGGSGADRAYRLWGSEGVRVGTEVQRVDNGVESRLLDLHRVRHIVAPSVTLWHADTTTDRTELPVYDDEVEGIAEGTAVRMAVDQTWQTQRGGPGRWRSVDVLKVNAELVVSSGDVDRESPVGRYFDFRPELSNLGDTYGTLDAAWQVTEVLGLGGDIVYDFEINQPARTDVGITLQQQPEFSAYMDLRYLNAQDSTTFGVGAAYELTSKYSVSAHGAYDTNLGQIQSVSGEIRRRYPNVIVGFGLSYNNITSETSLGLVLQPVGVSTGGARLRGLGTGG